MSRTMRSPVKSRLLVPKALQCTRSGFHVNLEILKFTLKLWKSTLKAESASKQADGKTLS